uniref:Sulfhydrylase FUB7 ) n=1 Tax=Ganoderma boninense TaxID=34458 RepID=A0A5K1K1I1_9APHY|nr:Sulfhydrylase FUB7 (EC (Fusaric acid biosynthesis protein 7) [Ganoderma boninense]
MGDEPSGQAATTRTRHVARALSSTTHSARPLRTASILPFLLSPFGLAGTRPPTQSPLPRSSSDSAERQAFASLSRAPTVPSRLVSARAPAIYTQSRSRSAIDLSRAIGFQAPARARDASWMSSLHRRKPSATPPA